MSVVSLAGERKDAEQLKQMESFMADKQDMEKDEQDNKQWECNFIEKQ